MGEAIERYDRKKARSEIRDGLWFAFLALSVGALALLALGLRSLPSTIGVAWLGGAAVLALVLVELARCRAWVRLPAAVLLGSTGLFGVARVVSGHVGWHEIVGTLAYGASAAFLAAPSTAALFERARQTP